MAADRSYKSTPRTRKGALTSFGSRTDIGCLRDHNEDSLVVTPPLFAVADGMGGHAAGEVASEIAVRVLSELAPEHPDGEALGRAIEEANRAVIQAAREGRGRQGMGTTMTAAMRATGHRPGWRLARVLAAPGQAPAAHARPQPDGRHDRGRAAHARRGAHASAAFGDHARARQRRAPPPRHLRDQRRNRRPPAHLLRRPVGHDLRRPDREHPAPRARPAALRVAAGERGYRGGRPRQRHRHRGRRDRLRRSAP